MSGPGRLGRGDVRRLLDEAGLAPKRSLGQNFVVDPNTVERIARLARVGPGDRVLEIGPGLGSLTLALAATGASVTAVEIDQRLAPLLRQVVPPDVVVVEGDALRCDWDALLGDWSWVLVANLPYNVATPLVLTVLQRAPQVCRLLVMVQREAGERLAAGPGGREYGAVSVRLAYFATARIVGQVSPEVFYPRPNVDSVLVEIERRERPAVDPADAGYEDLDRLVRAGFSGRRKMLRRALAGVVDPAAFAAAGIEPSARAEHLGVGEWGKLAACQRSIESGRPPS